MDCYINFVRWDDGSEMIIREPSSSQVAAVSFNKSGLTQMLNQFAKVIALKLLSENQSVIAGWKRQIHLSLLYEHQVR